MNRLIPAAALAACSIALVACDAPANVASRNLSKAADNFEILRRVVFYNGITDSYMLVVEGFCSLGNEDKTNQRSVTCKVGPDDYRKHFLGLSDNVTYFAEQIQAADVSEFHHRVIFRPQAILPDIDFQGDADDLTTNRY